MEEALAAERADRREMFAVLGAMITQGLVTTGLLVDQLPKEGWAAEGVISATGLAVMVTTGVMTNLRHKRENSKQA